jgi:hypothetical protein
VRAYWAGTAKKAAGRAQDGQGSPGGRGRAARRLALCALAAQLLFPALAPQAAGAAAGAGADAGALAPEDFETTGSPYYIYAEKGSHTLTVFIKDENGLYTVPLKTFPTATGRAGRMTPAGVFRKGATEEWHSWGSAYSPFATQYYPGLYVHGPIYAQKDFSTLYGNMAEQIGSSVTSGCLRTVVDAAYFLAEYCPEDTIIHIVEGSPMGFAAAQPDVAGQAANPSGKTLDELFPNLADLLRGIEAGGAGGADQAGAGRREPHTREEKLELAPNGRIRLSRAELELRISEGQPGLGEAAVGEQEQPGGLAQTWGQAQSAGQGQLGGAGLAAGGPAPAPAQAGEPAGLAGTAGASGAGGASAGGERAKLEARISPARARSAALLWISSDPSVATVSQTGMVEARGPGSARITAVSADGLLAAVCDVGVAYGEAGQERKPAGDLAGAAAGAQPQAGSGGATGAGQAAAESETGGAIAAAEAGAPAEPESLFGDVGSSHWAAAPIGELVRLGAIDAAAASFYPDSDITGAEFAKMLAVALGWRRRAAPPPGGEGAPQAWYEPYAQAAAKRGALGGAAGFEPDAYLTRDALCGWLQGALEASGADLGDPPLSFTDARLIKNAGAASKVAAAGLLNGFSDGSYKPGAYVSRAVAASVVCSLRALLGKAR